MNFISQIDFCILDFIQEHMKCAFLDNVLPFITHLADSGIIWIVIAIVFLFFKSTRKSGLMIGLALIMGLIIGNLVLKQAVARIRPYEINSTVTLLIDKLSDYSFPSGHTLASFEAAGVLLLTDRKRFGYPALVLAVLIAFSRLYLYVHFPTDVLAGVILGLAFAYISYKVVNLIYSKVRIKLER